MHRIWLLLIVLERIILIKMTERGERSERGEIIQHLSTCEYEALKLGSDFADIINSAVGSDGWDQRVHQEFIIDNLGFSPIGGKRHGTHKLNSSKKSVDDSPYKILNHKWIYMFGDSTTRQVWSSFAAPFQSNNFERNTKEWTRHYVSIYENS